MLLTEKVEAAKKIIIEQYEKHDGNIFISFSGGKDSRIMMHIAQSIYPDIKIVFSNTTNEIYDVMQYIKTFKDVIHVTPKLNFSQVIKKHGFPVASKEVSQKVNELKHTNGWKTRSRRLDGAGEKKSGKLPLKWRYLAEFDFDVTHKCCAILKKDPLEKWGKENGMKPVIALMKDESNLRKQLALFGGSDKKVYPFLTTGWEEQDIWDYATINNIRFAECYYDRTVKGHFIPARSRTGCEYCAFGIHMEENDRFVSSAILTPKRYNKMMNLKNNGITFKTVIDIVKNRQEKPVLDLYGVKIDKCAVSIKPSSNNATYSFYDLVATGKSKTCSCGSKNIKHTHTDNINFFDAPDKDNRVRNLWIHTKGYTCNDCNKVFYEKVDMLNMELRVTNRLIDYIHDNLDKMSMAEAKLLTNLSSTKLLAVAKLDKRISNMFNHKNIVNITDLKSENLNKKEKCVS